MAQVTNVFLEEIRNKKKISCIKALAFNFIIVCIINCNNGHRKSS